jgi:predicted nucleic acid-binding protein
MNYMSETRVAQFVDTNVLIYAHDRSAGTKHLQARQLLQELWDTHQGCLSIQVMQEFYVNVTRKVARPLAPAMAARILTDLAVWHIHRPDVEDILNAIEVQERYQLSFWDSMVVVSAQQLGCQVLWSEDLNAGL